MRALFFAMANPAWLHTAFFFTSYVTGYVRLERCKSGAIASSTWDCRWRLASLDWNRWRPLPTWTCEAPELLFLSFGCFISFLFRVCSPDEQATKVVSSNSSWCWNSIRSSSIWERTVVGQSNNLGLLSFRRSQEEENRRRGEEEKGTLPKRKEKERKKERPRELLTGRSYVRRSVRQLCRWRTRLLTVMDLAHSPTA